MIDLGTIASIAGLIGISTNELWGYMRNYREGRIAADVEARNAKRLDGLKRISNEGLHTKFLNNFYPNAELKKVGLARFVVDLGNDTQSTANFANFLRNCSEAKKV